MKQASLSHTRFIRAMGLIALGAASTAPCLAQDRAGALELMVGAAQLTPDTQSTELGVISPVNQPVPGSGFTTPSFATLAVTLRYWLTDSHSLELLGGIPHKSSIEGTGTVKSPAINPLGYTTAISPTVLWRYHLSQASATWRPSVALGVNYTHFIRPSLTPQFQAFMSNALTSNGTSALPSSASFSSSWNPAVGLGLAYRLSPNWKLESAVTYIPLKTTGTIETQLGSIKAHSGGELTINPTIWTLGLTHQF